jgi:hypothetical protein
VIESRSRSVLDAPAFAEHDTGDDETHRANAHGGTIARPVLIRVRKSSFTIRVDLLFTASRDDAFTTVRDHPVKTPVFA